MNTAKVHEIRGDKLTLKVEGSQIPFLSASIRMLDGYQQGKSLAKMTEYWSEGVRIGTVVHFRRETVDGPVDKVWPSTDII